MEFIKNIYLKYITGDQLKNYYAEQGINMKKAIKMIKQLEKKNKVLQVEKTMMETNNKMAENVKEYYESQGLGPQIKDETFLEYIALNLRKSSNNLEMESENLNKKLAKCTLESISLKKESIGLEQKIEVQKHNVLLFSKTLEKQEDIKLLEAVMEANCECSDKNIEAIGSTIKGFGSECLKDGIEHTSVMNEFNINLKKLGNNRKLI